MSDGTDALVGQYLDRYQYINALAQREREAGREAVAAALEANIDKIVERHVFGEEADADEQPR